MLLESRQPFRAGEWTVDPEVNALWKDGREQRVEPKVMQVLLTLASRQNHVFSKSELMAAVWPDTFVSEDVLTRCISILRRVTADSPHAPRFIRTVPKVGYKLVAPVQENEVLAEGTGPATSTGAPEPRVQAAEHTAEATGPSERAAVGLDERWVATDPRGFARRRPVLAWTLSGFALLVGLAVLAGMLRHRVAQSELRSPDLRILPFTTDAGEQAQPAFSPDGRTLALVRTAEDGGSRRICLKRIGEETCNALTDTAGEQFSPAWSPTGRQIAYLSSEGGRNGLYLADVDRHARPRLVYVPEEPSHWEQGALSWSPDGRNLVFPDHQRASPSSAILRLDIAHHVVEAITAPPPGWEGDLNPVYSPDGLRIAFTRASETAVRDLYWLSVRDGSVHQLTHERADINGITWTRGGASLVYSTNRSGQYALWRVGLDGRPAERLPVGTENASQPAAGPLAGQLAYTQGSAVWGIDRVGGGAVLTSTQEDSAPSLSPDGRWFAFQSRRSGTQQIWIATLQGESLRQLTSAQGPMAGSPAWSHHGDRILFDARPQGHSHIFSISAAGGPARQLTFGDANDIVPRWSNDDRTVYFRSNRGGRWQLWKLAAGQSSPVPLTRGDGMAAQESADGQTLFFTRGDEAGLWKLDLTRGQEEKTAADPPAGYWGYLQSTTAGVLTLSKGMGRPAELVLVNTRTGEVHPFAALKQQPPRFQGLSATPDLHEVLLTEEREAERHISLVSGFADD